MRSETDANNALRLVVDNTAQWQTKRRDWFTPVSKAPNLFYSTIFWALVALGVAFVGSALLGWSGAFEVAR